MNPLKFVILSDLHLSAPGVPVNGLDTGARTREALQREQAALGLPADGRAGQRALQALRAAGR